MCTPAMGAGLMSIGTLIGAYGQFQEGETRSDIARQNKQVALQLAEDARLRGAIEEQRQREISGQVLGTQRARLAGSGVDISSGSALDILMDTAASAELDALAIRANAAREAYGYQVQAENFRQESKLYRRAGRLGAVSTLLSGGGSAFLGYQSASGKR